MPRKKSIDFAQLRPFFDKPIHDVAKRFEVCTTLLKKICRKNGIIRWPHRKLKCIEKILLCLEAARAEATTVEESSRIDADLRDLMYQRDLIMDDPNRDVKISSHLKRKFGSLKFVTEDNSPGADDDAAYDIVSCVDDEPTFEGCMHADMSPMLPQKESAPVPVPTVYSVDGGFGTYTMFQEGGQLFASFSLESFSSSMSSTGMWTSDIEVVPVDCEVHEHTSEPDAVWDSSAFELQPLSL